MGEEGSDLSAAGWTVAVGAASTPAAAGAHEFHAIYSGEAFGHAARGIVAVVARGLGAERSMLEAAQLAVHSFVEGYFGAAATLGAGRAASLSLASINRWMYSQSRAAPERAMAASLSALIFVGRHVRIIHVGDCRLYRRRGSELLPLTSEHVRQLADGTIELGRSVGGDAEMHTEYLEDTAEIADRYVILSKGAYAGRAPAQLAEALTAELLPEAAARDLVARDDAATAELDATAIAIDVVKQPQASFDELAAAFAQLPLRKPPQAGENWDGFVLGRTVYRSRYTTLKLAQDTVEDREVVMKIPLPFMLQDEIFRAGFLREAWVGTTVRSPWIARYIEIPPERRGSLYLVMPYYRGETLEDRLLRAPPIGYLDGIAIALKLCAAVRDLAALEIVHRDLKPDNVILLRDGGLRLLDLGLAYLPGLDTPDDDRLGGTTRYMAPELFRGAAAGQRSEVFSLGVTFYRMFAGGAYPFGQREAVPLQRLRPDLPSWLGLCLARAIAMEPEKRFKDAGELATALEGGLQRDDGTPSSPPRLRRMNALRLWQCVAIFFAAAFIVTLFLLLRA